MLINKKCFEIYVLPCKHQLKPIQLDLIHAPIDKTIFEDYQKCCHVILELLNFHY